MPEDKPKVAIVHDWLYGGGAEQVVLALHKIYPEAPIYTSYSTDEWRKKLNNKVITGYLQNFPFNKLRKFLPLLRQLWFAHLDLSEFDIVISSTGNGEAKFIKVPEKTVHICYCHTPTHFYWRKYNQYLKNPGFRPEWLVRFGLKLLVKPLRRRDFKAAQKVDYFIANSTHIQKDIKKYYKRESEVIHPPVDTENFASSITSSKPKQGFVMWGRHVPDKRFDIAIKACNKLNLPLTVIGKGPDTKKLQKIAGPSVKFVGYVSLNKIKSIASNSEAFLFPSEEDFGISPVEAMSLGLPVIAYKAGGALDFVLPNKTGLFFENQTAHSLAQTLQKFSSKNFSQTIISKHAQNYSMDRFTLNISLFINDLQPREVINE